MSAKKTKVNYLNESHNRRKMGYYLRVNNFKKIAGTPILGRKVMRRRIWLAIATVLVLLIGMMYVLF